MLRYGIDLGGTKIEAKVFDAGWREVRGRRIPTPRDDYGALVAALTDQIGWLAADAAAPVKIGVGLTGYVDPRTGESFTTNVAASGHRLRRDLAALGGVELVFENDCNCLTLSEAVLGAGRGYRVVIGLIIGTGVGGGIAIDGRLCKGQNGAAGEFGHLGLPARLMAAHNLPLVTCGCGRTGCYETLVSGPGLARLCEAVTGTTMQPTVIAARAMAGDRAMTGVLDLWAALAAELISAIQCVSDPDCIVLGGGLSNLPDVEARLHRAMGPVLLPSTRAPKIVRAQGGDSSGTRGAALLTVQDAAEGVK